MEPGSECADCGHTLRRHVTPGEDFVSAYCVATEKLDDTTFSICNCNAFKVSMPSAQ